MGLEGIIWTQDSLFIVFFSAWLLDLYDQEQTFYPTMLLYSTFVCWKEKNKETRTHQGQGAIIVHVFFFCLNGGNFK